MYSEIQYLRLSFLHFVSYLMEFLHSAFTISRKREAWPCTVISWYISYYYTLSLYLPVLLQHVQRGGAFSGGSVVMSVSKLSNQVTR